MEKMSKSQNRKKTRGGNFHLTSSAIGKSQPEDVLVALLKDDLVNKKK